MNANCSKKAMLAIAGDLYLFQPSEATLENLRFWPIRLTIPCDSLSQSSICAWQCKFYEVGPQKSLRPGKVPAVTHNPEIEREEPRRVAFHAPPCLRVGPWRDSARAARKSHVTLQLRPPFRPDRVWGVAIQRRVLRTWPCSRRRRSDASPPSRGLNQGCASPKRLRSQLN